MKTRTLLVVLLVSFCASAIAQDSRERGEVFGGYSYLRRDFTLSVPGGVSGWDVSASVHIVRHLGIVADFSGFSPSGANPCPSCGGGPFASFNTYLGGPQFSVTVGRVKPFARFLVGDTKGKLTHADQQFGGDFSYFTYGFGGGADFGLNHWFALRGQVDWLHIGSKLSTLPQPPINNIARVAAGVVVRF